MADYLCRVDLDLLCGSSVLDERGYLPFALVGGQLLFHPISRLYQQTSVIVTDFTLSFSAKKFAMVGPWKASVVTVRK